jgi:hypothetical protein
MISKKIITVLFAWAIIFTCSFTLVLAQSGGEGGNDGDGSGRNTPTKIIWENPFKVGDNIYELFKAVVNNILLPIGGVIAVMAFIWAGFLYVTAQGNEAQIKKAHQAFLYTAIGTAVLFGAWVIANVIEQTIRQLG